MCGIVGFWHRRDSLPSTKSHWALKQMADALTHRGPDGDGFWHHKSDALYLAHRRLSIIDLSVHGAQPMVSADKRYTIVFNGEIYNYHDLKNDIDGLKHFNWRGNCDTEVMLEAISTLGLAQAVAKFDGMFAFALWDNYKKTLHLVRDRAGEKPLYYGWINGSFVFASELKAICLYPGFSKTIDKQALSSYVLYSYVPTPQSIYQGIFKAPPGCILTLNMNSEVGAAPHQETYWSAKQVVKTDSSNQIKIDDSAAIDQLDTILRKSIKQKMYADVGVGAFLSGGVDSSLIVALMQAQHTQKVKTFSIGFEDPAYDESSYASAVASHLGTEHYEFKVQAKDAHAVIPDLSQIYDEPFADSSQIPVYLVSKMAREVVSVVLSGDGGDELFAGYNRHIWGQKLWRSYGRWPQPLRKLLASALMILSPNQWDVFFSVVGKFLPARFNVRLPGDKVHKLAHAISCRNFKDLYHRLVSLYEIPGKILNENYNAYHPMPLEELNTSVPQYADQMMYWDLTTYLLDDILVKVDRASMSVSLETRVPFLDHHLIDFAWKMPLSLKLRHNQTKWILRQLLYQYVPAKLIERPKMGFGIPIGEWMRGPLRDWVESLIDDTRLNQQGIFNSQPIKKMWHEHLTSKRNWQHHLWNILIFQSWYDVNMHH